MVKSVDYAGYGFNLYQEKNKPGQFIGRIEPGSPADLAGLKENDRYCLIKCLLYTFSRFS